MRKARWDDYYPGAILIFEGIEWRVTITHDVFVWLEGTVMKQKKRFISRHRTDVYVDE